MGKATNAPRAMAPVSITAFCLAISTLLFVMPATGLAQSMQRASPEEVEAFHFDAHHNVGKNLPSGIDVVDKSGKSIDLRSTLQALNGPVVLVVVTTLHCPPCQKLLDYIKQHPGASKAHLAVLRIKDSGHDALSLPEGVLELHTPGNFDSGFLARHFVPATFVFDHRLKLIKRRTGLTSPRDVLRYPPISHGKTP